MVQLIMSDYIKPDRIISIFTDNIFVFNNAVYYISYILVIGDEAMRSVYKLSSWANIHSFSSLGDS